MASPPSLDLDAFGAPDPGAPGSGRAERSSTGSSRVASAVGHRGPALVVALLCVVGVWQTWRFFVGTATGRLIDAAAFDGAQYGRTRLWQVAEPILDVISVPFIAGVLVATMLLAVLRRRMVLALQVAVLMGGANLTTQVLKHVVLSRPDLALDDSLRNTLPSGHTTAAASVAAALVLVVPRRVRPAAALVGAAYTVATGISTLVGGWHRPSDVVAAVLVVLGWAGLATALGARGTLPPGSPHPRETAVVASTLVLAGLTAGVLAAVALERTTAAIETGLDSTAALLTAYGGGSLGVGAVVSLAFGTLLAMRAAADPRPAHAGPSSRTVDRRS